MNSHWANEQARQRIADLRREAAGTDLLRAARFEQGNRRSTQPRRARGGLHVIQGMLGRTRASLAAITPWSRGLRRG